MTAAELQIKEWHSRWVMGMVVARSADAISFLILPSNGTKVRNFLILHTEYV